jgi:hypothetical protein
MDGSSSIGSSRDTHKDGHDQGLGMSFKADRAILSSGVLFVTPEKSLKVRMEVVVMIKRGRVPSRSAANA